MAPYKPKSTLRAAFVPVLVLAIAGAAHHYVHYSRAALTGAFRALPRPLTDLPIRIADFNLDEELPLDRDILQVADVDAYVYRRYSSSPNVAPVLFYVGYWGRTNVGMGHGPEVCYPLAGWTANQDPSSRSVRFKARGDIVTAQIQVYRFQRLEPEGKQRVCVAFVSVTSGEFRATSRGTFLHAPRTMDEAFLAHIQGATPVPDGDWAAAETRVLALFTAALPEVSGLLWAGETPDESLP
jgi:hypothetical protein